MRLFKNNRHMFGLLLLLTALITLLSSCQSSKYYVTQLPVYSVKNIESWKVIDSLVISNRSCDRFDGDRRFVWVMIWDSTSSDTVEIYFVENRVIFTEAFGCIFLGGEPVVLQGDAVSGQLQKTETFVKLKTDVFEADYPENASSWRLIFVNDKFTVTLSEPMPCWEWRDLPPDE